MSRNNGKRAEREVIALLQPVIDDVYQQANKRAPILQRNTIQSDFGGHDIVGLEWLSLEVKHHENRAVPSWWKQCTEQASKWSIRTNLTPVLWYRRNHEPWNVRMYEADYRVFGPQGQDAILVDIGVLDFQRYLYRRLMFNLGKVCLD